MKKRILFVIDSLNSGGAEKSLVSLLSLFNYNKYDVDLLMFSPNGLYLPLLPNEVNILPVPDSIENQKKTINHLMINKKYKELYIRLGIAFSLRNPVTKNKMHNAQLCWNWYSKGLKKLEKEYDVAIAYSQGMPTYFVHEKVCAKRKICWINTDYKLAPYNKNYDHDHYEHFNHIVAVSNQNRNVFINELPSLHNKTLVIYDILSPTLIKNMALDDGGFQDHYSGIRLLTIGRLVELKGYDLAIEACCKLKKEGIDFKWYVIGEGILEQHLKKQIKKYELENNFILLGTHPNPYPFLKDIDIYIQPSRFEGFGLAIAEAKVFNKPIVATNFTVVHDQLKNNENGLIVDMNAEAIYKGVKNIINCPELRKKLALNLKNEEKGTELEIEKIYTLIENK